MQDQDGTLDEEAPGKQADVLKSYLSFAKRAIGGRKLIAFLVFAVISVLGCVGLAAWPRTFTSDVRLVVQSTGMLDPYDKNLNPFESASEVIRREDNRKALVKQLNLVKQWDASRAPALKVKDKLTEVLIGRPSEADVTDALVSMLESRLTVYAEGSSMRISVDWAEPKVARSIANAAKDSFLESRHTQEISVIEEKMSILEGHATRVRGEIEGIATELGRLKSEKLAEIEKAAREVSQAAAPPAAPVTAPAPRRAPEQPALPREPAEDPSKLKEELASKKSRLSELQSRRNQSLLEEKARLSELKFKYTDDHPEVRTTEQRVALRSRESPEELKLASDIQALEQRVESVSANAKLEALGARSHTGGGTSASTAPHPADVLPSEILKLLDTSRELDPVVSAQLTTAIGKYGELRSDIRTARVMLDAAQAAFQHRYKIVAPASLPLKPSKPKVPIVLAAVFLVALLLSLLAPVLLELRTGVIVELWQVHQFRLPVLGELHMPPRER